MISPALSNHGLPLRWPALLATGLILQVLAHLGTVAGLSDVFRWPVIATSYAAVGLSVVVNLRYWGFRALLVGAVLNTIVLGANGWRMPVDPDAMRRIGYIEQSILPSGTAMASPKHAIVSRDDMNLWPLADVIVVPVARRVISAGDIFVYSGALIAITEVLWLRRRRPEALRPATSRLLDGPTSP